MKLNDKELDTNNIPIIVGANGTSLGAIGQINCEIRIGKQKCKQTFLVCQNLKRSLILGVDFAKTYAAALTRLQIIPDEYCLAKNPNMYVYSLYADLADRTEHSVTSFIMVNLSNDQYFEFPKNHIVAFAQKDNGAIQMDSVELILAHS